MAYFILGVVLGVGVTCLVSFWLEIKQGNTWE